LDNKSPESDFLKINEAARYLGVSARTVYRRVWSKELPAAKIGGLYFIRKSDLDSLVAQGMNFEVPSLGGRQQLKCGACLRLLKSDEQIAEVCRCEGCDELICTQCWSEGINTCARHAPSRQESWEDAVRQRQRGELSYLLKSSTARLREINYLNRVQSRLARFSTLIHPLSGAAINIENWDSLFEMGDERTLVMRLMGRVALEVETLAQVPLNTWLRCPLPPSKNRVDLPVEIRIQAVSRLLPNVRDGYETCSLGSEELLPWLNRIPELALQSFVFLVLAAPSGWDASARQVIQGRAAGSGDAYAHRLALPYLFDIENGELIFNNGDERARRYAELFSPQMFSEEVEEAIRAVEKELVLYESLTLEYAGQILPYSREVLKKAFEGLAKTGRYALVEVSELGLAIVRQGKNNYSKEEIKNG